MKVRKKCSTCRHYELSPIRGQGWCRNPALRKPHERSLVGGGELVCDKKFYDFWEPLPSRRGEPAPRADAGPTSAIPPRWADGPSASARGVAGGPRLRPPAMSWLPDLSPYLSYFYVTGATFALVAVVILSGLLTGPVESGLSPSPSATAVVPTVTPAVTIPSLAPPTPTASRPQLTPTPVATPTPAVVVVANTDGDGVFLRRTPVMGDKIMAWAEGTELEVVGADVQGEGQPWKQVKDPKGNVGYVPAKYTRPK